MDVDDIEAALRRTSAALDEVWQLVRELRLQHRAIRVETLSTSLANPIDAQVEMTLSNARIVIQTEGDRDALIAVARAASVQGVLSETALARVLKDYEK